MKKILYDAYVHLCQDTGEFLYGKCSCKAGAVVVANIVLHFYTSCVNIKPVQIYFRNGMYLVNQETMGQIYFLN